MMRLLIASMTIVLALLIVILGIIAVNWGLEEYLDSCGLSKKQARNMVVSHLMHKDPQPEDNLQLTMNRGTCSYDYYYHGPAGRISYRVFSTQFEGVKLTWWDYDRNG